MIENDPQETKQTERRILFDPATPAVRSISRVVIVTLIILQLAMLVGFIFYSLHNLILLLILSVFFGYLIDPLVKLIRRPFKQRGLEKYMPRSLAIVVAYLAVFTVVALFVSYLAPRVSEQFREFAKNLPGYTQTVRTRMEELNQRYQSAIPEELRLRINEYAENKLTELGESVATGVRDFFTGLVPYLPWLVLIPVIAFFFLKDINAFKQSALSLFPAGRWRYQAEVFFYDLNRTLAAYTRAQLISCLLIGTVCTIAFYILGVPYALLLGIMAGALEFIPLVGPLIIGLITVSICLFYSPWQALNVSVFLLVLRGVHDYVTYPRIVREGIHLHPIAIILAVLAGAEIGGVLGVFLSIPVVAILAVLYKHILWITGRTTLMSNFLEGEPVDTAPKPAE